MEKYFNNVTNQSGDVIIGALVSVTKADGTPAVIYAVDGGPVVANPLISGVNGLFSFYAADGVYTITISGRGITTFTITDIKLSDFNSVSLAASSGAALVGNNGETVAQSFNALQLSDYAALRAYTGPRKSIYVTGYMASAAPSGTAGVFVRDDSDTTSADNGGTTLIAGSVRWKRQFDSSVNVQWFGAKGDGITNDTAAFQACINYVFTRKNTASLNQLGGVVWVPTGRYKVTQTLTNFTDGMVIRGEPSGLNSVPLAQVGTGAQIFCDSTVAGFPMFTVNDGGPVTIQDIALNGTQTVTNSSCIRTGDGVTNIGITQAHFSNVRFTGFSSVFIGSKLADATFYDCGFEYNTTCFNLTGGTHTSLGGIKFVGCIFFGGADAVFTLAGGAALHDVNFSACIFQNDPAQVAACDIFKVYAASFRDATFASCSFIGAVGDYCLRSLSASSEFKRITFAACNFKVTDVIQMPFQTPIGATKNIILTGCILQDSKITSSFELTDLTINSCAVTGASVINLTSCHNLQITGNNFFNATAAAPVVLTDVFNRVQITANIFADAVGSIPINSGSTKVNINNNIGVIPNVSVIFTTITAGSGGWTNHAIAPQVHRDNSSFCSLRGLVTNAAPGAYSIMGALPLGFRPAINQIFILPESSGTGSAITEIATNGDIYFVSRTGTGSNYDLSALRFYGA